MRSSSVDTKTAPNMCSVEISIIFQTDKQTFLSLCTFSSSLFVKTYFKHQTSTSLVRKAPFFHFRFAVRNTERTNSFNNSRCSIMIKELTDCVLDKFIDLHAETSLSLLLNLYVERPKIL